MNEQERPHASSLNGVQTSLVKEEIGIINCRYFDEIKSTVKSARITKLSIRPPFDNFSGSAHGYK